MNEKERERKKEKERKKERTLKEGFAFFAVMLLPISYLIRIIKNKE